MTIEQGCLHDWDDRYPKDDTDLKKTKRELMAEIIDRGIECGADGSEIARVLIISGY